MKIEVFDEDGRSVVDQPGELVCTMSFPSLPLYFWGDIGNEQMRNTYFRGPIAADVRTAARPAFRHPLVGRLSNDLSSCSLQQLLAGAAEPVERAFEFFKGNPRRAYSHLG